MQTVKTTTPRSAATVVGELHKLGFVEGPPAHAVEAFAIDRQCYRRMKCPTCNHGGQKVSAYHRGREYRLICVCRACGNAMEM